MKHKVGLSSRPFQSASPSAGGAVKVGGKTIVIVDGGAPVVEQLVALAEAVCALSLESSLLSLDARSFVEHVRSRRHWRRKRLLGLRASGKMVWFGPRSKEKVVSGHVPNDNARRPPRY